MGKVYTHHKSNQLVQPAMKIKLELYSMEMIRAKIYDLGMQSIKKKG